MAVATSVIDKYRGQVMCPDTFLVLICFTRQPVDFTLGQLKSNLLSTDGLKDVKRKGEK